MRETFSGRVRKRAKLDLREGWRRFSTDSAEFGVRCDNAPKTALACGSPAEELSHQKPAPSAATNSKPTANCRRLAVFSGCSRIAVSWFSRNRRGKRDRRICGFHK